MARRVRQEQARRPPEALGDAGFEMLREIGVLHEQGATSYPYLLTPTPGQSYPTLLLEGERMVSSSAVAANCWDHCPEEPSSLSTLPPTGTVLAADPLAVQPRLWEHTWRHPLELYIPDAQQRPAHLPGEAGAQRHPPAPRRAFAPCVLLMLGEGRGVVVNAPSSLPLYEHVGMLAEQKAPPGSADHGEVWPGDSWLDSCSSVFGWAAASTGLRGTIKRDPTDERRAIAIGGAPSSMAVTRRPLFACALLTLPALLRAVIFLPAPHPSGGTSHCSSSARLAAERLPPAACAYAV